MPKQRKSLLLISLILFVSSILAPAGNAVMNTGPVRVGEHGLWFIASKLADDNPGLSFSDAAGPGEIPNRLVLEYPGTIYSIDSWMVPVGNHLSVDCQSSVKLRLFRDQTQVSPSLPISSEDGFDYRVDNYKLMMEKPGTYTAKISGGLTCKWRTDGRTEFYSAQNTYTLAKVISQFAPRPMSISSFKCQKNFLISTQKNSTNRCLISLKDPDFVADSVYLNIDAPRQLFSARKYPRSNSWIRTSSGWSISIEVPIGMVTPALEANLRRQEEYYGQVFASDDKVNKGEKFTETASGASLSFVAKFSK